LGLYEFALKNKECTNKFLLYNNALEQEIAIAFIHATKKICPKFFEKLMKQWRIVENIVVPYGIENDSYIPKNCICSTTCTLGTHEERYTIDLISGEEAYDMSIGEHEAYLKTPGVVYLDLQMSQAKNLYDTCMQKLLDTRAQSKQVKTQQGDNYASHTIRINLINKELSNLNKSRELLEAKLTKLYFERYCSVKYGFCLVRDGGMPYVPYFSKPSHTSIVTIPDFALTSAFPEGYGPGAMVVYNLNAFLPSFSGAIKRTCIKKYTFEEYEAKRKMYDYKREELVWRRLFKKVLNNIKNVTSIPFKHGRSAFSTKAFPVLRIEKNLFGWMNNNDKGMLIDFLLQGVEGTDIKIDWPHTNTRKCIFNRPSPSYEDVDVHRMRDYIKLVTICTMRQMVIKEINHIIREHSSIKKTYQPYHYPPNIVLSKVKVAVIHVDSKHSKMIEYIKQFKVRQLNRKKYLYKKTCRKMRKTERPEDFLLTDCVNILSDVVRELKLRFKSKLSRVLVSEDFALKLTHNIRSKQAQAKSEFIAELSRRNALSETARAKELNEQKLKAAELRERKRTDNDRSDPSKQNARFVDDTDSDSEDDYKCDDMLTREYQDSTYVFSCSSTRTNKWTYVAGIKETRLKLLLKYFRQTLHCGGSVKFFRTPKGEKVKGIELQGEFTTEVNNHLRSKNTSHEMSDDADDSENDEPVGFFQKNKFNESDEEFEEETDEADMMHRTQKENALQQKNESELKAEAKQTKSNAAKATNKQIAAKILEKQEERKRLLEEKALKRPIVMSREEKDKQIAEHKVREAKRLATLTELKTAEKLPIKKGNTINTGIKSKANRKSGAIARLERKNHLAYVENLEREDAMFIQNTLA
jgi:translation initiation factor 1 (eIF-1/SUI1)